MHGNISEYKKGCRCSLCTKANATYMKKYHADHKDDPNYHERYLSSHRKSYQRRKADPTYREHANDLIRIRNKQKRDEIGAIKLERGCAICGYRESPFALDFHHKNGKDDKEFVVSKLWKYPWSLILEEVQKCDVLCANCHRVVTMEKITLPERRNN